MGALAIIGADHWHAPACASALRNLGEQVVAVSASNLEAARKVAGPLGARAYADWQELLARESVEFVFAYGVHREMTVIARGLVEAGVAFVMEKPMGLDCQELASVAAAAENKRLFAGPCLQMRCTALARALLDLRAQGQLGRMICYFYRLFAGGPERYLAWGVPWMLDPATAGSGPLFNFGPHVFDLFLLLSGEEPDTIYCRESRRLHGLDIPDQATVVLSSASGLIATVEVGYVCPETTYDEVFSICTDQLFVPTTTLKEGTVVFRDGRRLVVQTGALRPLEEFVRETLRRFRAGEAPLARLGEMCRILQLIGAATESARRGTPVRLN